MLEPALNFLIGSSVSRISKALISLDTPVSSSLVILLNFSFSGISIVPPLREPPLFTSFLLKLSNSPILLISRALLLFIVCIAENIVSNRAFNLSNAPSRVFWLIPFASRTTPSVGSVSKFNPRGSPFKSLKIPSSAPLILSSIIETVARLSFINLLISLTLVSCNCVFIISKNRVTDSSKLFAAVCDNPIIASLGFIIRITLSLSLFCCLSILSFCKSLFNCVSILSICFCKLAAELPVIPFIPVPLTKI